MSLGGEKLIKKVYEAIRNSPHWEKSLLVVTSTSMAASTITSSRRPRRLPGMSQQDYIHTSSPSMCMAPGADPG